MITMRRLTCGTCGFTSHYLGHTHCPRCHDTDLQPGTYEVPEATVTRVWPSSAGQPYAVDMAAPDGNRFRVNLARANVSWADPDVWAYPERYGIIRWYCPGHNGGVCQYGMCDENRYTGPVPGIEELTALAAA